MTKNYANWLLFTLGTLLLLLVAAIFSITMGEARITLWDIIPVFRSGEGMEYFILTQIRLPRVLLAIAVGGSLSLSGAILQGIFRNPLVEPYTLGISGGAAVGVALTIVMGLHITIGMIMLPIAGFSGALATILLVSLLGFLRGGTDINKMLLIGVMISFVASSSMMFLMSVTTTENMHGIVFWIMGSLDEPNRMLVHMTLYISLAGLVISYMFARSLNALRLGESKASNLGINSKSAIRILFLLASLLTGISVSVAGVIGFAGLVIPHLIRIIIGSDYRFLLVGSFLGGGLFLILCDVIARTIISPNELPIGVITGMAGGILFIAVLTQLRKSRKHGI
jgi:iron complex transport system permease protein